MRKILLFVTAHLLLIFPVSADNLYLGCSLESLSARYAVTDSYAVQVSYVIDEQSWLGFGGLRFTPLIITFFERGLIKYNVSLTYENEQINYDKYNILYVDLPEIEVRVLDTSLNITWALLRLTMSDRGMKLLLDGPFNLSQIAVLWEF